MQSNDELKAENARLQAEVERLKATNQQLAGATYSLSAERDTLAEARYNECLSCADDAEALGADAVAAYLRGWAERKRPDSHQSSPAAKDEPNDCAHSEANKHGCPECGEEFKP